MQNKDFKQGVIQDMSAHIFALMFLDLYAL